MNLMTNHTDAYANTSAAFGQGTGPIYASDVICTGEEDSLTDCEFTANPTICTHLNDAGITCSDTCELFVLCLDCHNKIDMFNIII